MPHNRGLFHGATDDRSRLNGITFGQLTDMDVRGAQRWPIFAVVTADSGDSVPSANTSDFREPSKLATGSANVSKPCVTFAPTVLTRRLYFQGLGIVYLIAFLSLWSQIHGLIGEQGLLPAGQFFRAVHDRFGFGAYQLIPSLCWFGSGDGMLHVWCGVGTLVSLVLIAGLAVRPALLLLWLIYLSLCLAGQDFLSFQWDTLLLEMTICSLLLAPRGWRPDWRIPATTLSYWPLWGLVFKLMFLSGITKLLSGDASWLDGTALQFHCYTQPIPSWPAWYAYQCPLVVHRLALTVMFAVEVIAPFLAFAGRWGRIVFGLATIGLMIAIEATGNFGFFNLQTIVLCIPLLDDRLIGRLIPRRWRLTEAALPAAAMNWRTTVRRFVVAALLSVSFLTTVSEISRTARGGNLPDVIMNPIRFADGMFLSWGQPYVLKPIASFRTINGYGLFRVMTVRRDEIVVEISEDGANWTACEFPYKPGRIDRPPPIVAPHMPRLDWQMWFAALNARGNQQWLGSLVRRILEGSPTVAKLLGQPDLAKNPPKFVRLTFYEYKFTTPDQRQANGAWWNRTFLGNLTEPIQK